MSPQPEQTHGENSGKDLTLGLIWACDRSGVIGDGHDMPWHVPEDFAHFKQTTSHHPVAMGRSTWESIPPRFRPLPGRHNIILSTTLSCADVPEGVVVVGSFDELFTHLQEVKATDRTGADAHATSSGKHSGTGADTTSSGKRSGAGERATSSDEISDAATPDAHVALDAEVDAWIIGGGRIYRQAMDYPEVRRAVITEIDCDVTGYLEKAVRVELEGPWKVEHVTEWKESDKGRLTCIESEASSEAEGSTREPLRYRMVYYNR